MRSGTSRTWAFDPARQRRIAESNMVVAHSNQVGWSGCFTLLHRRRPTRSSASATGGTRSAMGIYGSLGLGISHMSAEAISSFVAQGSYDALPSLCERRAAASEGACV
jgi:hypothetical protein